MEAPAVGDRRTSNDPHGLSRACRWPSARSSSAPGRIRSARRRRLGPDRRHRPARCLRRLAGGILVVQPNESRVLILFGRYAGTITQAGLWWCNPFNKRKKVSLRVRNFQSDRIKVNDASGNPIEIAAVIVWRVTDTAKAIFDVVDYEQFVTVQSETALRHIANRYPYDDYSIR